MDLLIEEMVESTKDLNFPFGDWLHLEWLKIEVDIVLEWLKNDLESILSESNEPADIYSSYEDGATCAEETLKRYSSLYSALDMEEVCGLVDRCRTLLLNAQKKVRDNNE
jgi:hypothetical protein